MKKIKSLKKLLMVFVFAISMAMLIPTISPITTQAAVKKISATKNYKKAPSLKKGKNLIKSPNPGYTKFIAPADGKYQVTMYNINPQENTGGLGTFYIEKPGYTGYPLMYTVKTQGGRTNSLKMANRYSYENYYKGKKVNVGSYLAKRSCIVKLKKGEVIYFDFHYTNGKCTYNIDIKKK